MAELPEIVKIRRQLDETLRGKVITDIALLQEKCANVPAAKFGARCIGAKITRVENKGKWFLIDLDNGETILISLGMGADFLYFEGQTAEEKFQVKVNFTDGTGFTIRFWWFGKFLLASQAELPIEPNTKDIAPHPFEERFTYKYFRSLFKGKKGQLKAFLMDQKNIGGIGNMYMHDILFKSRLHPQKKISDMTEADFESLYRGIMDVLHFSESKGAFSYEKDFFGQKGAYSPDDFLVGYREKKPCPVCGGEIVLLKTGSTSSYLCPECQKL